MAARSKEERAVFRLRQVSRIRERGGVSFELRVPALELRRGQFVTVVGASGCGKSTLLDLLALVLKPSRAEEFSLRMTRDGEAGWCDVTGLEDRQLADIRKAHIGYVLQSGGLLPFLNVRENILLSCRLNGVIGAAERVERLAGRLGIADQLLKKPAFLSGGQRQRTAIARAIAHGPGLVLADEPTAAVDRFNAAEIRDVFRELVSEMDATLVVVTHDEALMASAADRVLRFAVRKASASRTVSEVQENP